MGTLKVVLASWGLTVSHYSHNAGGAHFVDHWTGWEAGTHVEYQLPKKWYLHSELMRSDHTDSHTLFIGVGRRF